ncbi:DUF3006 domain-containing protein [bacterium 1XD42-8]|jgi:hypothetical protein|nr:DUF3006 domain-containing protein [Lachnospiraceae bacterium]RKJ51334.1 DUF3006 domain-containing protein [bacterium 1XD42-8]
MKYIIEGFEGTYALCEDEEKNTIKIPKYKLPLETKEGDVIKKIDSFFHVDKEETARRKEERLKKSEESLGEKET